MKTSNNKMTIEFENFIKDNKLSNTGKEDDDNKRIEIKSSEDIVFTIHYLVDYLGKYLFADKIMNFEEIFKSTLKKS